MNDVIQLELRSLYRGSACGRSPHVHRDLAVGGLCGRRASGIGADDHDVGRWAAGNTRSEVVIYPDTPHAFHADYRPSYRKDRAEEGLKRATEWFKQYLG